MGNISREWMFNLVGQWLLWIICLNNLDDDIRQQRTCFGKAKLENVGFGIVRFIQSFGLFEKIRIVNKVMRSQGEQTRKSWVYNNNYNIYQEVTSRKTLKLNLKIIYSGWLINYQVWNLKQNRREILWILLGDI